MLTAKAQLRFFVFLFLGVAVLMFLIIWPYFSSLFLAIIFVIAFSPLHELVRKILRGNKNLSAFVSTVLVLLVIFIPVSMFGFLIAQEVRVIYEEGIESGVALASVDGFIVKVENRLHEIFPGANIGLRHHLEVEQLAQQGLRVVNDYFNQIFMGLLKLGIGAFLMVLALFYLFRDGSKMMDKIRELSPLKGEYTDTIFSRIAEAINAVVRGRLLVGVIQGFVIGTGFFVFGLPSPLLWGSIAAVASMLPVVGPLMIIIPTSLVLFFSGFIWSSIGIMAWGVIAVIVVDEYLGSVLIDQRMHIHPFLVLLSVMGGISLFGAIGFVVGPVVLALMFAILKIYPLITTPDAYERQEIANL